MFALFALKSAATRATHRAAIIAAALAAATGGAALAEPGKIPQLASSTIAWTPLTINGGIARYGTGWFDPPKGLRGPIHQDPEYPLRGNETRRPASCCGPRSRSISSRPPNRCG